MTPTPADGRRFPVELVLDVTGPTLNIHTATDDDPAFTLDREPDRYGVQDDDGAGRLYWTIPPLDTDRAEQLLAAVHADVQDLLDGSTTDGYTLTLTPEGNAAAERISARCAALTAPRNA
ncbi:hypothetical protein [Streptomyces alboflavus]|uniref:hypothetical protein n=1 Tax=Streptomyces alboflavus TaxID=67267 RepID=UPI0036AC932A